MLIPPKYILTPSISRLLTSIEVSREIIEQVSIPLDVETNIRRQSTLKSSLFSARIEGNDLTLEKVENTPSKNQKRVEVYNILKAINFVRQNEKRDLALKDILKIHEVVMNGLSPDAGNIRKEVSAIFNSAGIAIYLPPPPKKIETLLEHLIKYANSSKETFVPVKAVLTHYCFEKIHPFLDGNGRAGRILIQKVLAQGGYGMKGLLAIEEYIDNKRSEYYDDLGDSERDVTTYVEFMLGAIDEVAKKTKEMVLEKKQTDFLDYLLPRRAEIYRIIEEQKLVNFTQLKRRFLSIGDRMLRYDLKKLQDQGLIRKRGQTRGVYYEIVKN